MIAMTIYEDTGQKTGQHENIRRWMERHGVKLTRVKLDTGDYIAAPLVSVDTKHGMEEVYNNIVGDHDRFRRECVRAQEDGIQLVILVEDTDIRTLEDVANWKNPLAKRGKKPRPSKQLMVSMRTMSERYGVRWEFCTPAATGRRICEILGVTVDAEKGVD